MNPLRVLASVAVGVLLSSCSGGGGSSAVPTRTGPGSASNGKQPVSISLKVPISQTADLRKAAALRTNARKPQYVASTTASYSISINTLPAPTVINGNVNNCVLNAANSDVSGPGTPETAIATMPSYASSSAGTVWVGSGSGVDNLEQIQADGTQFLSGGINTPIGFAGDANGEMWWGTSVTANRLFQANNTAGFISPTTILNGSPNPYAGVMATGNDGPPGNLYYQELSAGLVPQPFLGEASTATYVYVTDIAVPGGGTIAQLATGSDKIIWFVDGVTHKLGTFNASTTTFTEFAFPPGMTRIVPVIAPSSSNTDAFVFAEPSPGGTLSLVDYTEGGASTVITALPAAYNDANVLGMTYGPDGALWFTTTGAPSGSIVRVTTVIGNTPFAYAPQTASAHITGITVGSDKRLYYTESEAGKVGLLFLSNSCTNQTQLLPGTYTATVKTYDQPGEVGNQLGYFSGAITVVASQVNNVGITLNPVVQNVQLLGNADPSCPAVPTAEPLMAQGYDADGNLVAGSWVDVNGNPITVTFHSSAAQALAPTSGTQNTAFTDTFPATVGVSDTLTGTSSGGALPGGVTPFTMSTVSNCG